MKRKLIPFFILLTCLISNIIITTSDRVLWIQGYFNMSISFVILLLLLISLFIFLIFSFKLDSSKERKRYRILLLIIFVVLISTQFFFYSLSSTNRSFYQESNKEIIVVDYNRFLFGEIRFYERENFLVAKELTSCSHGYGYACDYSIEGNKLVIVESSGVIVETKVIDFEYE